MRVNRTAREQSADGIRVQYSIFLVQNRLQCSSDEGQCGVLQHEPVAEVSILYQYPIGPSSSPIALSASSSSIDGGN